MRNAGAPAHWAVIAIATVLGAVATPLLGAAAWQGLQLDSTMPIDTQQARSEVALDLSASAFTFDPVVVTIEDKAKKAKKIVGIKLKLRNNSDKDYFVYATATLVDAEGKTIASKSEKEKADDEDSAHLGFKFELPYADIARLKSCKLHFAFEKE
jgi:hypothetical protein